jgi:hypothetical protein
MQQYFDQNSTGWKKIHEKARESVTIPLKEEFIKFINDEVGAKLPCGGCKMHTQEFIKTNDIREYYNTQEIINGRIYDIGFFKWSWKLHNSVNKKLYKPELEFNDAFKLYY